jgi:hypothetical protein
MTSLDDPLVIATIGLVVVTVGLVVVTSVYAYYTKKLSEHTGRQVRQQEALLQTQLAIAIAQIRAQALIAEGALKAQFEQHIHDQLIVIAKELVDLENRLENLTTESKGN